MHAERPLPSLTGLDWQADLDRQIALRNSTELSPSRALFSSYAALLARARTLEHAEHARSRLQSENQALSARVRELERVAADSTVRSVREQELEKKKDELHDRLQELMTKENEFYRGMAELSTWKDRANAAESRVSQLEAESSRRTSELALIKKEYVALNDENQLLRRKSSTELQTCLLDLKSANEVIVSLQQKIANMDDEIDRLRAQVQRGAQQQQQQQPQCGDGSESLPLHSHQDPNTNNPLFFTEALDLSSTLRTDETMSYPKKAGVVVKDAHGGALLQSLCVCDTQKHIYTAGSDKKIRVHDALTGASVNTIPVGNLALSMDITSHYLFAGCADRVARFYDVNTMRALELAGHSEKIVSACLSASAQHGFTASSDSTIKLWDIRRQAALKTLLCSSTANDVCVSGESIYAAHYNGCVTSWDRRTAARTCEVRSHQRIATCVRVSSDGKLCVSLGKDNSVCVRDIRQLTRTLCTMTPPSLNVTLNWSRLSISPDSRVVAVGTGQGEVLLLSVASGSGGVHAAAAAEGGVLDTLTSSHDGGGSSSSKPVTATCWGRTTRSPLVSIGDDNCIVVWQA